jgi:superfamily II DNA or RNA helicase
MGFSNIYDKLIVSDPINKFIEDGWLAPYSYYSINDNSYILNDINGIDEFDIEGDYKVSALERVMDRSSIRANLLKSYRKYANGKKGIIYSISRKHSDHICSEYKEAGVNIVRIDSKTPRDERRLYVQRFKNGQIDIIVNVDIFSEGFDCPDIEFIQLARPTRSLVKYLQQVGRGLRPTENKSKCIILDNVGAHMEFGLPNADRIWETEFEGDKSSQKNTQTHSRCESKTSKKKNFEEGDDDLMLIEDVKVDGLAENTIEDYFVWKEVDDILLTELYNKRKCPTNIIATVFKIDEGQIIERLTELNLI